MRIAHLIPNLARGGAERLTLDVVHHLRQLGHEAEIFCLENTHLYRSDYPLIQPLIIEDHFKPSLKKPILGPPRDTLCLELEKWKPDVVHSHLWAAEVALVPFWKAPRFVTHVHDNMPQLSATLGVKKLQRRALTDSYERFLVLRSWRKKKARLLCISNDALAYIQRHTPRFIARNALYWPNAIDIERFRTWQRKNRSPKEGRPLTLVNAGSFVPKKNQAFLLEVLRSLISTFQTDARLILLGEGPLREEVVQKAREMGLSEKVEIPGNVAHVENWFQRADIYVHSALYEPFGLVILEAMAAGLPVVALDGRGNRDFMQDGKNGYLIPQAEAGVFAEKIWNIHHQESLRQKFIQAGLATAENYDMRRYCEKLLQDVYGVPT